MKTTVEVADSLMARAREVARSEGVTLRELVEAGLRRELGERRSASGTEPYRLPDRRSKGGRVQPGIDLTDWRQIREMIYEPSAAQQRSSK